MGKLYTIIIIILVSIALFFVNFDTVQNLEPGTYYNVYLEEEFIGVIDSKDELEDYIDELGEDIKEEYNVDTVYAPNGLEITKINTYNSTISSVEEIYEIIEEKQPFTIRAYKVTLKGEENQIFYITDKDILEESLIDAIKTFVGTTEYENYITENQSLITSTGEIIDSIYIDEEITIKEENVSVNETIFINSEDLNSYLLFGEDSVSTTYIVKYGDTIEQVSFDNQISTEEFLISNTQFSNVNNLLYPGQTVKIEILDPKISVVVEQTVVKDDVITYSTVEQVDEDKIMGTSSVVQTGVDGLIRVNQLVKTVNGNITYVEIESSNVLVASIDEIISIGGKYVPDVGGDIWTWPTNQGYTITSGYGYRSDPFTGEREFHAAIDIATGYGSPIYAANNGVIYKSAYHYSYGNYIIINHNNGYYTLYAHMSTVYTKTVGEIVEAGTVVGLMGMTGSATGPHLHFEVWYGAPWSGTYLNPWSIY
ncbi:MAG: M23 family metallopeptidase [Mycoplasmatota bacterium]